MGNWFSPENIIRFDKMRNVDDDLPPPWRVFPSYRPTSMGRRMGVGETYMAYWRFNQANLDENAKRNYRRKYRAPLYWYWAYWNLESPAIAIFVALTGLLTWLPRIVLHLFYLKLTRQRIEIPD